MTKNRIVHMGFVAGILFLTVGAGFAGQTIVAQKVAKEPVIDGVAHDKAWSQAKAITTHDKVADIDIVLKVVYTDDKIFFLVTYPDKNKSITHRNWVWNAKEEEYKSGKDREDGFVLKWNMEGRPVDLSVFADNSHTADVWFWKACRTNPVGYADDKNHRLSSSPIKKAREIVSKSGKKMYLQRLGDKGDSAYISTINIDYKGNVIPRFKTRQPTLSRADIKSKGAWKDGGWTIEFARVLKTGNADDVSFDPRQTYQFGVSRYEVAGREKEPDSEQPLYGCGDVNEELILTFGL